MTTASLLQDPADRALDNFFDELTTVLSERVAGGSPVRLLSADRRGEGNSWETYLVTVAWDAGGGGERTATYAVKRQPVSGIAGTYDVDREVALLQATARLGLPVPGVMAHRSGTPGNPGFFAMERLVGSIPLPHTVTRVITDPGDRASLGRRIAREMARLHAADPATLRLPQLAAPPEPENTGRVENSTWAAVYERVVDIRIPILDLALAWLDHRSDLVSGRVALVHNDFRVGNLVVEPGSGDLIGILDWETAHFSDPVADIAWFALRTSRGRSELACKLIKLSDFLDEYEKAAGWRPTRETLTWWGVQSLVKTAIGCLQAVNIHAGGERPELRYANMAHSVYYSLGWLNRMLRDGEWGA
ncbi:phosphotransferase family protein [Streptomyces hirsutus]|uniref:phosphotransferase family protein n=1 Tax=Streptomyces hirsutus TaxID=35620 RepID=UPI00341EC8BE